MRIYLYIEGHKRLRPALVDFIHRALGKCTGLNIIACGATPIKDFCDGLAVKPNDEHVLLMDADVLLSRPYFESVRSRRDWRPPRNKHVSNDQLHFMVIMMEAWFLADPKALLQFYGQRLQQSALPVTLDLEELSASDVKSKLKQATRPFKLSKGIYDTDTKLDHSIAILKLLNPQTVASRAPHCKRLFDTLTQKLKELDNP